MPGSETPPHYYPFSRLPANRFAQHFSSRKPHLPGPDWAKRCKIWKINVLNPRQSPKTNRGLQNKNMVWRWLKKTLDQSFFGDYVLKIAMCGLGTADPSCAGSASWRPNLEGLRCKQPGLPWSTRNSGLPRSPKAVGCSWMSWTLTLLLQYCHFWCSLQWRKSCCTSKLKFM